MRAIAWAKRRDSPPQQQRHEKKVVIQCYITWAPSCSQIKCIQFLIGNYYNFYFFISFCRMREKKELQMNHGTWCACMCVCCYDRWIVWPQPLCVCAVCCIYKLLLFIFEHKTREKKQHTEKLDKKNMIILFLISMFAISPCLCLSSQLYTSHWNGGVREPADKQCQNQMPLSNFLFGKIARFGRALVRAHMTQFVAIWIDARCVIK